MFVVLLIVEYGSYKKQLILLLHNKCEGMKTHTFLLLKILIDSTTKIEAFKRRNQLPHLKIHASFLV